MSNESSGDRPFHVLALSGGGFRGLFTATVLSVLEEAMGPLARRFDLICGTSAGGLLALGLATELRATQLTELFVRDGNRIFGSHEWWRRWPLAKWWLAKHASTGLRHVLTEQFGRSTLGDLKHRVIIPAVNYSVGKCQLFKTPHHVSFERDHKLSLVDVAMATSAAPTYFPLHRIEGVGTFVDGGLVCNSPGYFGLHEARHFLGMTTRSPIRVLAIGTMTLGSTIAGSMGLDRGVGRWGARVFDLTISAQDSSTDYLLRHELGPQYLRIDEDAQGEQCRDIKNLDRFSRGAVRVLQERGMHAAQRALGDGIAPFPHA